jgi:hypothetical protein
LRRVVALGAAVGTIALGGCGVGKEAMPLHGDLTLEQAREFDEFPLYYAGERVDELPLVAILRRTDTANFVSFVYGDCTPAEYDQGCAPPAEIQVWPRASRGLGSYDVSVPGTPTPERMTIRGVPAAFFDDGTRLEVFAGPSTVVIFAESRQRTLAITAALRCVQDTVPGAGTLDC